MKMLKVKPKSKTEPRSKARTKTPPTRQAIKLHKAIALVVTFPILICAALPLWWILWFMLTGSVMPLDSLMHNIGGIFYDSVQMARWPLLPKYITLSPLVELLLDTPQFFVMFWNSIKIAFFSVLGQFLIATPAAWALSRLRFFGRKTLLTLYIVLMLMPFQVTMVPNYLVATNLGIMDTLWAIILPFTFSAFPVFIMVKGFDAVPRAMLEAIAIDGASQFRTFWHIGLPLGMPSIFSALILGFLEGWNAIEQPMTLLKTPSLWPLSLYLSDIVAGRLGLAMISSLVVLIPPVLIFLFGQLYLELGIQSAGIKE